MVEAQPDPVPNSVADVTVVLVVGALVDRLSLLQAGMCVREELITFNHAFGHCSHLCLAWLIGADGGRLAAIDHPELRVLERRLERHVVDVFSPGQPAQPLARTIPSEAAEVHDDDFVGGLRLAVGLRMKSYSHVQLGPSEPHQLLPEDGSEHRISVRDNGLRDPMEADDVGEEDLCH